MRTGIDSSKSAVTVGDVWSQIYFWNGTCYHFDLVEVGAVGRCVNHGYRIGAGGIDGDALGIVPGTPVVTGKSGTCVEVHGGVGAKGVVCAEVDHR